MRIKRKDIVVCGFALFAIFFGAGNMIFPPYLGILSGKEWLTAILAFLLADPVLPILGVFAVALLNGHAENIGNRVGKRFSLVVTTVTILLMGPVFAIPRTGATTHEIFVAPLFPQIPSWLSLLVFFGLTLYLALNSNKVVDKIGKFLTPVLLVILALIIISAITNPPGELAAARQQGLFSSSFKEGYQTMDAMGAPLIGGIIIVDIRRRGYGEPKTLLRFCIYIGILAGLLLALVYGSLTYAGATVSQFFTPDQNRTGILVGMVEMLLGKFGKISLGIAVALACLTTSVGLTSICGNYFYERSHRKLPYLGILLACALVEYLIALIGVDSIIFIAAPILSAIYPVVIVLIVTTLLGSRIKYDATIRGAVVGAFAIGLIQAIAMASKMQGGHLLEGLSAWVSRLPLHVLGFEWLLPCLLCSLLFTLWAMGRGTLQKKELD